jgi:hypothetical protein
MARIRTIKPEFFSSEDIVTLTPLARLFYVSLWCEADREGRLEWRPGTLKMRYFPGDNCKVEKLGDELAGRGLIVFYTYGGKQYAAIPTFKEHQVINNRESPSVIPEPPVDACLTRESGEQAEGRKEGKEGKGKERKADELPTPDGVSPSVWADFQKLRNAKKSPATQTAIDGIKREADRAGLSLEAALAVCCQRGWTGFKADWMAQPVNRNDVAAVTVPGRQGIDPALAKVIADASKAAPPSAEIRAKLQTIRNQG